MGWVPSFRHAHHAGATKRVLLKPVLKVLSRRRMLLKHCGKTNDSADESAPGLRVGPRRLAVSGAFLEGGHERDQRRVVGFEWWPHQQQRA